MKVQPPWEWRWRRCTSMGLGVSVGVGLDLATEKMRPGMEQKKTKAAHQPPLSQDKISASGWEKLLMPLV